VKEKVNQLFRDKLVLVMLVLGLLTIVAAAGAVQIHRGSQYIEESPFLEIKESDGIIAENETKPALVAGNSDADETRTEPQPETTVPEPIKEADSQVIYPAGTAEANHAEVPVEARAEVKESLVLDFTEESRLAWPVRGNVILGYSMDTTTYFPTLEQYKCNPANIIQSDISTPVAAPADSRVLEVGNNEEIGNFVRLDLGNEYSVICGQLKEIPVVENEYLKKGDVVGYVAEPTKYYSVEGNNLYLELLYKDKAVDALDYLE